MYVGSCFVEGSRRYFYVFVYRHAGNELSLFVEDSLYFKGGYRVDFFCGVFTYGNERTGISGSGTYALMTTVYAGREMVEAYIRAIVYEKDFECVLPIFWDDGNLQVRVCFRIDFRKIRSLVPGGCRLPLPGLYDDEVVYGCRYFESVFFAIHVYGRIVCDGCDFPFYFVAYKAYDISDSYLVHYHSRFSGINIRTKNGFIDYLRTGLLISGAMVFFRGFLCTFAVCVRNIFLWV